MTGTTPAMRRYPNILVTGTPGTGKTTVAEAIAAQPLLLSVSSVSVSSVSSSSSGSGTCGGNHTNHNNNTNNRLCFYHVDSKAIIDQYHCTDGHDEALQTDILDEDKFLDALEMMFDHDDDDDDQLQSSNDDMVEQQQQQQHRRGTTTGGTGGGIVLDFHIPEIFPERWFDLVLVCRTSTDVLFDRLTHTRQYSPYKRDNNVQAEIMHVIYEAAMESYEPHLVHVVDNNTREDLSSIINRVQMWVTQWQNDRLQQLQQQQQPTASSSSTTSSTSAADDDDNDDGAAGRMHP